MLGLATRWAPWRLAGRGRGMTTLQMNRHIVSLRGRRPWSPLPVQPSGCLGAGTGAATRARADAMGSRRCLTTQPRRRPTCSPTSRRSRHRAGWRLARRRVFRRRLQPFARTMHSCESWTRSCGSMATATRGLPTRSFPTRRPSASRAADEEAEGRRTAGARRRKAAGAAGCT